MLSFLCFVKSTPLFGAFQPNRVSTVSVTQHVEEKPISGWNHQLQQRWTERLQGSTLTESRDSVPPHPGQPPLSVSSPADSHSSTPLHLSPLSLLHAARRRSSAGKEDGRSNPKSADPCWRLHSQTDPLKAWRSCRLEGFVFPQKRIFSLKIFQYLMTHAVGESFST